MYTIDRIKVKQIMVSELGYAQFEAEQFLDTIPSVHDKLQTVIEQWLEDRTVIDISVLGITLQGIIERRRCNFIIAIRYLNLLLSDDLLNEQNKSLISMLQRTVEVE